MQATTATLPDARTHIQSKARTPARVPTLRAHSHSSHPPTHPPEPACSLAGCAAPAPPGRVRAPWTWCRGTGRPGLGWRPRWRCAPRPKGRAGVHAGMAVHATRACMHAWHAIRCRTRARACEAGRRCACMGGWVGGGQGVTVNAWPHDEEAAKEVLAPTAKHACARTMTGVPQRRSAPGRNGTNWVAWTMPCPWHDAWQLLSTKSAFAWAYGMPAASSSSRQRPSLCSSFPVRLVVCTACT